MKEQPVRFSEFLRAADPRAGKSPLAVDGPTREALRAEFTAVIQVGKASPGLVEAILGVADHRDDHGLAYDVAEFPKHVYRFDFNSSELLIRSAFVKIEPTTLSGLGGISRAVMYEHRQALMADGLTDAEVEAAMGPPLDRFGWWPVETRCFGPLIVESCHGIVTSCEWE